MGASSMIPMALGSSALDYLGAQKAQNANRRNVNEIEQMFANTAAFGQGKYEEALKAIEGVGAGARSDALAREGQQVAGSEQQMASGGMFGSTVGPNLQRGIHSDTTRALQNIDAQVAQMKAGLLTGEAGFRQQNTMGLGGIMGGVQTNYSPMTPGLISLGLGMFGNKPGGS